MGISIDHVPCLKAWIDSMGGVNYALLSDFWPHGAIAKKYGVLRQEGYSERAIFIIDKKGIIRYIDIHDIDDQPSNHVLLEQIRQIDPEVATQEIPSPEPEVQELPRGGIVMYCTNWCPDCRRAREWLSKNGLSYTEVDITANPTAAAQVRIWANGYETTPTFDIDGEIVIDFDENRLRQILKGRLADAQ